MSSTPAEALVFFGATGDLAYKKIFPALYGMARRGLVMKLLMALKQICNHPAQYLKDGVLTTRTGRPRSGKLELLDELLDTILAESESAGAVLIFTQYVEMARLLEAHLSARGIASQLLHGGTPVARRRTPGPRRRCRCRPRTTDRPPRCGSRSPGPSRARRPAPRAPSTRRRRPRSGPGRWRPG